MSTLEIRPRFVRWSGEDADAILARFDAILSEKRPGIKGLVVDQHIYLKIPREDQHYWSPQLNLEVVSEEKGSKIKGLFGPRPSVWLMFAFFYFLLGFASVMVAIIGFSQMNLGLPSRILWLIPVFLGLIFLMYSTAKTGQRMGLAQMEELYRYFDSNLESEAKV